MKAIRDPIEEKYGMCYIPRFTEEFEKLIKSAKEKIEPYSSKEISNWCVYFKAKGEEVDGEHDCCDDEKCIKEAKINIRKSYGKGTHVEEIIWNNDGDHENIERCSICEKPLNEFLTWCNSELEYLEENKPWNIEFLKEQGFLIYCILQSSPTMDCDISGYSKNHPEELKKSLEYREQFFQRIGELVQCIIKTNF